jgi:hypothetical protein
MALMGWVSGGLAVVCLCAGLLHLLRVAVLREDVAGELSHAAMGVGMAAMFSPLGNPVPGAVWTVVFALGIVWFGGAVTGRRARSAWRPWSPSRSQATSPCTRCAAPTAAAAPNAPPRPWRSEPARCRPRNSLREHSW